jgi:hypothetical protein
VFDRVEFVERFAADPLGGAGVGGQIELVL